ncbi:MAG: response regulator [Oscillospiraceae bacterium]|nr:response regulator [Oscillospiraceae bacterium]
MEQSRRRGKLLVIDDEAVNRIVLRKIFSQEFEVHEEDNGRKGLEYLLHNEDSISAVLLDVMMPEMTGIEVLQHLMVLNLQQRIPVFLITSETSEQIVRDAYQMGVMDVIKKPIVSYVVLRRVKSVVELFETRRHLRQMVASQQLTLLDQANQIIRLNRGLIEALATAIEFRDEESGGHVQRISKITKFMLENTSFGEGLSEREIDNISLASITHDVGKITISDAILTKPGRYTPEEHNIMKAHTTNGVAILSRIPQLKEAGIYDYACDIALHHHERWDGNGYPDGLKGDEITPWSQVVALADVYDALSCKRVYKAAYSRERVVEMIRTGQCGIFNPKLLDAFFTIEEEIAQFYHDLPETQGAVM